MKKRPILSLLCLAFISLIACGQKKETAPSSEQEKNKVTMASETTGSMVETQTSMTTEGGASSEGSTKAHFNGSYYSIQGKYGEVIIVNKKHPLSASYAPGENPVALAAFWQLHAAMRGAGFDVSNQYSGFRSYETQAGLYNNYVASDGQENADRYSARPGYSEHQTGLAFDLIDSSGALLTEPNAANWLAQNAHHYGFIVRYLEEKEGITGYMAETWHIRYIGEEATDIYKSGLTLEEYYGIDGGGYE